MAHSGVNESGVLVDPKAYFHSIIGRAEGALANDWLDVLKDLQRRGIHVNPRPGERADATWPFYALSLMVGGNGDPRGRLWLPTALPTTDDQGNQWFTREVQVIADNPGGAGLVWQWRELGGHPYVPVPGASHDGQGGRVPGGPVAPGAPVAPGVPVAVPGVDALIKRIEALEAQMRLTLQDGSTVAFETENGHVVSAEGGGGAAVNAARTAVGGWEKFKLRRQK